MLNRRTSLKWAAQLAGAGLLAGCGFKLRGSQSYRFQTLAITGAAGDINRELRESFGSDVRVLAPDEPVDKAQLVLNILQIQREKVVVGVNASGQVREFQLRIRLKFSLRTPQGRELLPETEILQQRDITYNETSALAKETEEALLYKNMQTDIVQQLLRRLSTVNYAASP